MQTPIKLPAKSIDIIDHYGFRPSPRDEAKFLAISPPDKATIERENVRMEKWRKMLALSSIQKMIETKDKSVKNRIRKGIPDGMRFKVWPMLAETYKLKSKVHHAYSLLLECPHAPSLDDIKLDVPRTFPYHKLFDGKDSDRGQQSLQNVLKAISITHPKMGYCQGLNFPAAIFLMYLNDEEVYWMLKCLLIKYKMEPLLSDLTNLEKPFYIIDQLVREKFPKVAKILDKEDIHANIYAISWVISLFATHLPFNVVLRIMDAFLLENFKIIYRIVLTIIKYKAPAVLKCERIDELLTIMRDFTQDFWSKEDEFMDTAFSIKLSKKEILRIERTFVPSKPRVRINSQN